MGNGNGQGVLAIFSVGFSLVIGLTAVVGLALGRAIAA